MRVLVIFAHPVETSYQTALYQAAVDALKKAGHEVDDCDLYRESFNPVLSRDERLAYHDVSINRAPVVSYVERLLAAEALVLVYPVWNYGFPAILKGFFDRVFLPGVSFHMADGKLATSLHNIRKLTAITTYGGARWQAFMMGNPPRKTITRLLRRTIRPGARVRYLAHYDMNNSTPASRSKFLDDIKTHLAGF